MSLYEGIDVENVTEPMDKSQWSSQIKILQTQLHLKKAAHVNQKARQVKIQSIKEANDYPVQEELSPHEPINPSLQENDDYDNVGFLVIENEYDPKYPNDYDKIMILREEEKERERADDWKKEIEERERRRRERFDRNAKSNNKEEGTIPSLMPRRADSEEDEPQTNDIPFPSKNRAAIAPPPSVLREVDAVIGLASANSASSKPNFAPALENSVAARIMAKYGFREGQGLGKSEQGMSQPLQVEKTSKRGGKILHEKDIPVGKGKKGATSLVSTQYGTSRDDPSLSPSLTFDENTSCTEPADEEEDRDIVSSSTLYNDDTQEEMENRMTPPGISSIQEDLQSQNPIASSATFPNDPPVFKTPSKVVLLRNMVGPGEVDPELETETREECSKYGEVRGCVVFEIPSNSPLATDVKETDRVRIFVEFARVESAIKAVVDLNGRFFGGRTVHADYYNLDKFRRFDLGEGI